MARTGARSTHAVAEEVAQETATSGGSALKAALAGFFGAAGADPGVLLGPVTLLVGGVGVGARAFDGRCLQPGWEGKRPRGFVAEEGIPHSAYAAIPGSIWALSVCCGYHSGVSLAACVRSGISIARKAGAARRAEILELVGALGPRIFLHPPVREAWIAQFGPVEGGMVQPQDLAPKQELDRELLEQAGELTAPWATPEPQSSSPGSKWSSRLGNDSTLDAVAGVEHGLVAADQHGMLVALSFRILPGKARLGDFEVTVPLLGVPVRRGVTRIAPRTPLPVAFGAALRRQGAHFVSARAGGGDSSEPRPEAALYRDPASREVTALTSRP